MHFSRRRRRQGGKRRRTKRGGAGIFFDYGGPEDFLDFALNSTYKKLSNGAFGVTTLATLDKNFPSPYQFLDTNSFGEPVKKLVIKFCLLGKKERRFDVLSPDGTNEGHLTEVKEYSFREEINVQTEIFQKTMEYGEPLCPAIVYATTTTADQPLLKIVAAQQPDNDYLQTMKNAVYKPTDPKEPSYYGVIAMELADGFETWGNYKRNAPRDQKYDADPYVFAALLRIARDTGYSQGDFHGGNIMVKHDPNLPGAFLVTVLDYGLAVKMTPQQQQEFNLLFDGGHYFAALTYFCDKMVRKDGLDLLDHELYDVVCYPDSRQPGDTPYPGDAQLEQSIKMALDTMTERENRNVAKAANDRTPSNPRPLLPLSKGFRNNVFSGVRMPDEDYIATSEKLLSEGLKIPPDKFAAAIRDAMNDADLSKTKLPFIRAVVRAVQMMEQDQFLMREGLQVYIRCYMVCEGAIFKGQTAPYDSVDQLPDKKMVKECHYAGCKDQRPLPSFLDSLSPRGMQALDMLTIPELDRLLCNPNTYLMKNRIALARKFNERGASPTAAAVQEEYQFPFQNERFIPRNKPMTIKPLTRKREADTVEMMEMMKRKRGAGRTRRRRAIRR